MTTNDEGRSLCSLTKNSGTSVYRVGISTDAEPVPPPSTTDHDEAQNIIFAIRRGRRPHPSNPQARSPGEAAYIFVDPVFNMSANDDAGSKRNGARLDDDAANFVYTGQENVPDGVIRVRVHPSIRVIRAKAFFRQTRLISVELHDGIEVIQEDAFYDCRSLREILFPPSVRAIKDSAFYNCSRLTTAILNDGLEEIGEHAFARCALVGIAFPPPSGRSRIVHSTIARG